MSLDNIVIGEPIENLTLDDLGISPEETTLALTVEQAKELDLFLPKILVHAGLFKNTSEVKRIHNDRVKSKKIKDENARNLWRNIDKPEMTSFKIGKRVFWLVVGNITQ
jgi:hypothetical protein